MDPNNLMGIGRCRGKLLGKVDIGDFKAKAKI